MTVGTYTMPDWEVRFFAGVSVEVAEQTAKVAKREHETASAHYIASLRGDDRTKVVIARTNFSRSLKRFHATQKNLNKAKAESTAAHTVTLAQ